MAKVTDLEACLDVSWKLHNVSMEYMNCFKNLGAIQEDMDSATKKKKLDGYLHKHYQAAFPLLKELHKLYLKALKVECKLNPQATGKFGIAVTHKEKKRGRRTRKKRHGDS